jgi:hypothetical protein
VWCKSLRRARSGGRPVILVLGILRQKYEFESNLDYIAIPHLKNLNQNNIIKIILRRGYNTNAVFYAVFSLKLSLAF